ncbi:carbohydrate kinase family protein [Chryseobacterium gleum]|uniref:carbohydrate kinase family protein n=1 Tax=Chryseobacterium gleum TaxID=250 RepID=UPI0028A9B9B6|nr:carbohydrate kinase [Chryseobacterium gleum]
MQQSKSNIICFGEVLWDIFPDGQKIIGGAPFNVAYHLNKMGIDVSLITSIGNDTLGYDILDKIATWEIPTGGIQINTQYPTSTVIATIDEHNDAKYEISSDVAWDYIESREADKTALRNSDAIVFGSLATRNKTTKNTLFELLESSSYRVFDINLRAPFYEVNVIKDLLYKTDLAKLNKAELMMVVEFMGRSYKNEIDNIKFVQDAFDIQEIIISKGSKGAIYGFNGNFDYYPAVPIKIEDTIGSGDSFLAGFLSVRFKNEATSLEIMQQAVSLGAFITGQKGACPEYLLQDFIKFRDHNKIVKI